MTLPVSLNDFPNPVGGVGADVIAFNVRGQDNILATAVNQIIDVLGGGGFPLSVPASQVTAGTFGAGAFVFSTPTAADDTPFDALVVVAGSGSLGFTFQITPSATAGSRAGEIFFGDGTGGRALVLEAGHIGVNVSSLASVTFGGSVEVDGDLSVATSKFTVDHATGNVVQGPSLQIVGGSDTYEWLSSTSFLLTNITTSTILAEVTAAGDLNLLGALNAIGGLKVNNSKFTVAASTGNGVFAGTVTASNLSGTNTGDQTNISGNAATATALQTARAINGVNFDGTAGITLTTATGGWTVSGGNLVSDSDLIVGVSSTFTVAAPSGNTVSAGTLFNKGNVGIGATGPTSTSPLNIIGLPTSAVGLATGDIYSLAGVLHVV